MPLNGFQYYSQKPIRNRLKENLSWIGTVSKNGTFEKKKGGGGVSSVEKMNRTNDHMLTKKSLYLSIAAQQKKAALDSIYVYN